MDKPPQANRINDRVRRRAQVYFSSARSEGAGYIVDLSLSGAQIETSARRIERGDKMLLTFNVGPEASLIDIRAEVVRQTDDGFALQFKDLDPDVEAVLRAALAMGDEQ